jgi:hypothetical protein
MTSGALKSTPLKLEELRRLYGHVYGKWSIIVDGSYKQQHWGRIFYATLAEAERRCERKSDKVTIVFEDIVGRAYTCCIKY